MGPLQLAVFVGSLQHDSPTSTLASALQRLASPDIYLRPVQIDDLPPFNRHVDDEDLPAAVRRLKADIRAAQGLIFVTCERGRMIPPVLRNAIDHAASPSGQNPWAGKPAGIMATIVAPAALSIAPTHLRQILAELDVPTLGQPEAFVDERDTLFDASGEIRPLKRKKLQRWLDHYVAWVRWHAA